MIVDTSALMAVILGESDAEHVLALMTGAAELGVSAATVVEASIVAEAKAGREAATTLRRCSPTSSAPSFRWTKTRLSRQLRRGAALARAGTRLR